MSFFRRLFRRRRKRDILPDYVKIGRGTYGVNRKSFQGMSPQVPVTIGNFCSIAADAQFMCLVGHPTGLATTYPLRTLFLHPQQGNQDAVARGGITLGHDVWIGARALVMSGVTIGDGAIIGAGAIVTRDIPPYAVAVGNPARVVRFRFPPDIIAALLDLRWWDWPDDKIRAMEDAFYSDIETFLAEARLRDAPVPA